MSIDEFASNMPVRPPIVNRNTNPSAHKQAALYVIWVPYTVASHLKILIPVGKAIPLQAWRGPEGSRRLRLPDFKTVGTLRW